MKRIYIAIDLAAIFISFSSTATLAQAVVQPTQAGTLSHSHGSRVQPGDDISLNPLLGAPRDRSSDSSFGACKSRVRSGVGGSFRKGRANVAPHVPSTDYVLGGPPDYEYQATLGDSLVPRGVSGDNDSGVALEQAMVGAGSSDAANTSSVDAPVRRGKKGTASLLISGRGRDVVRSSSSISSPLNSTGASDSNGGRSDVYRSPW
ncbi:hypothetical protein AK36_5961 [Burkholderia vietnamiensis LMG 10929]|nr:hypothetical protein AK36_5961 [Burkholderia vietnamiensis LMG 10929]